MTEKRKWKVADREKDEDAISRQMTSEDGASLRANAVRRLRESKETQKENKKPAAELQD